MEKSFKNILFLLLLLVFSGCIKEIEVFKGTSPFFVVDGVITNEPGPHKVTLRFTKVYNVYQSYYEVEDAIVRIIDDLGNEEILTYGYYGRYYTSDEFKGEIGRTYYIDVTLRTGANYQSIPETMLEPANLENVYHHREGAELVFYASLLDNPDTKDYYRWRFLGTFEFHAPLGFKDNTVCWVSDFDNEILILDKDLLFNGDILKDRPVHTIELDYKLNEGYSGAIKLHKISKRAYEYWEAIEQQIGNNGTIFETANFYIPGNIFSTDNPDKNVLGYFGVSAVSSKRSFVGDYLSVFPPISCGASEGGPPLRCLDCTKYSASSTNKKPDFWPK